MSSATTAAPTSHNHLLHPNQQHNNNNNNNNNTISNGEHLVNKNLEGVLGLDSAFQDSDADTDAEPEVEAYDLPLGPLVSLKEQLDLDKDDASLRKWKEQLLGSVDVSIANASKEPEVKVLNLTIESPGRPNDVVRTPFRASTSKATLFTLKEGCKQQIKFEFVVSNNIVCGLKYIGEVWKKGIKVDNSKKMVGTFGPREEPYKFELEKGNVPSGIFARGSYSARTRFVDDDGKCHFDATYYFDIQRNWASP